MHSSTSPRSSVHGDPQHDAEKQAGSISPTRDSGASGSDHDEGSDRSDAEAHGDGLEDIEPEMFDLDAAGMAGIVNRALSRISTNASWSPGPPPDGGREAWLAALCGHLVIMNTWGIVNSFGIFQAYYTTVLPGHTASEISWIGSLQVFLTFCIGAFTGRFTDAGFFRPVQIIGTCFVTLGVFTASAATQYWQLILAQGICMGLGNGFLFTPAISVVSTYFEKRRSLAIGLAAAGSTTGGLIYPAMARQLLSSVGFGWTMRAMGFVQLATLIFCNVVMRQRLPPRRSGSLVEWGAFKEAEYTLYALGMFFNFWGLYFGFYYVAAYSRTAITPTLDYTESLNLLLVLNGVGLAGRLVPNYFADRVGPLTIMAPACLGTAVTLLAWMAVDTKAGMYAWTVVYGIVAGGIQSLFPAGLSSLTSDLRRRGTRMGMTFTIVSFAVLTGNPIAGAIITAQGGRYWGAQLFTGLSLVVGMSLICAARVARQRRIGGGWRAKV